MTKHSLIISEALSDAYYYIGFEFFMVHNQCFYCYLLSIITIFTYNYNVFY